MLETETALQNIINAHSWEQSERFVSDRISNLLGKKTLALVEQDATFDPNTYDPAFDDTEFEQLAA